MNEMRKLMEAVENLTEGVKVNYDSWTTAVPKNLNEYHIAILRLMSDGKSRERANMIRSATELDPNPISSGGFAGWNKLDYDLYKKGLLDVVDIRGGRKVFQINAAGLKALKLTEANQGGKTEHSGAKHGKGAYYGRKKDAKQDSNKNRRKADKDASMDETVEIIGENITFDSTEAMLKDFVGQLRGISQDDDVRRIRPGAMDNASADRDQLSASIKGLLGRIDSASVKTYPSRPTHGRRPRRR